MKKFYALLCTFILAIAVNTTAQNTVSIPNVSLAPDPVNPVSIPIVVDFSVHPVGSFEIQVEFDGSILEYQGVTATSFGGISAPAAVGTNPVLLTWEAGFGAAETFIGDLIFINFIYTGTEGVTDLDFTETTFNEPGATLPSGDPSWLADDGAMVTVVTTTFNRGSITHEPMVPLAAWGVLLGVVLIAAFAVTRFYRIV